MALPCTGLDVVSSRPVSSSALKPECQEGSASRERTRSPEGDLQDSWESWSNGSDGDWGKPGPARYHPDDRLESHHQRSSSATIGHGPGHTLFDIHNVSPGPGAFTSDDKVCAHRKTSGSAFMGSGPGHQFLATSLRTPGPARYSPDDRAHAHHRHFPNATIGKGPGHKSLSRVASAPGPADFHVQSGVDLQHKRASSVGFPKGPAHSSSSSRCEVTPSPASYQADDRLLAGTRRFPTATIGDGPGHQSLSRPQTTSLVGPGSYSVTGANSKNSWCRHSSFGTLSRSCRDPATAEERLCFRRADLNHDGHLDIDEVARLLQHRFPNSKPSDARAVFNAADTNRDGKLDLDEVTSYTHSSAPRQKRMRDRMVMALATPGDKTHYHEGRERAQFQKADVDMDGDLEKAEVEAVMLKTFPDIKRRDVEEIWRCLDQDKDGKVDARDVMNFTRSRDPEKKKLRDKFIMALSAPDSPCRGRVTLTPCGQSDKCMRRVSSASTVGTAIVRQAC